MIGTSCQTVSAAVVLDFAINPGLVVEQVVLALFVAHALGGRHVLHRLGSQARALVLRGQVIGKGHVPGLVVVGQLIVLFVALENGA